MTQNIIGLSPSRTAEQLTRSLNGRWHGNYGICRCPAHDDHEPSLSIRDGDTTVLFKCFAGCEQTAIFNALKHQGEWDEYPQSVAPYNQRGEPNQPTHLDTISKVKFARRLWQRSSEATDTPATRYLSNRGITLIPPPTIRFLPEAKHSLSGQFLPCMIAAINRWPSTDIAAVHRTFLSSTSSLKASVSSPKMSLGKLSGGAVQLAAASEILGLAEGIETALSAMQLYGDPVWAACGSNLAGVAIPNSVKHVVVYADSGEPGRLAAAKAVETFCSQGRDVTLVCPLDGYGDFNDYLVAKAKSEAA
jgi:putative DNA primase/helicase